MIYQRLKISNNKKGLCISVLNCQEEKDVSEFKYCLVEFATQKVKVMQYWMIPEENLDISKWVMGEERFPCLQTPH